MNERKRLNRESWNLQKPSEELLKPEPEEPVHFIVCPLHLNRTGGSSILVPWPVCKVTVLTLMGTFCL